MSSPVAPAGQQNFNAALAKGPAIAFEHVRISFGRNRVLDDVSFELQHGETKALMGVAGSGKSTILKLALGLEKPDEGHILVMGQDVTTMQEDEMFELRRHIGMVFQESALFDSLTVEDNVGYRLIEEGVDESQIRKRVEEALRFVELEHTINMFPAELSGGMRRRVAIARAIITQPEILLYDSPTGGLDPVTSNTIIELILKERDVYHTSALLVSHRLQDALTLASHYFDPQTNEMKSCKVTQVDTKTSFLLLRDGKIIFDGTARELASSRDPYIREYIS
jgi:phospholipid/cholesterol/gamma-HCH transport system ATP-binding protein